ncbi:hypothetical protein GCM10009528_32600 [Kineococcus aurantiacus]
MGHRQHVVSAGERYVLRTDLGGPAAPARARPPRMLAAFVQSTDIHVQDTQPRRGSSCWTAPPTPLRGDRGRATRHLRPLPLAPGETPAGATGGTDVHRAAGFPVVPGLPAAAIRPFSPVGLRLPRYAVHGDHDGLVTGDW